MSGSDLLYVVLSTFAIVFLLKKRDPKEQSEKTKEETLRIEHELDALSKGLEEENKTRTALQKETEEKANEVLTPKELADFFNNRKP